MKRTSGSTGVPLTIRIDEPAVQWKTACTIRSDEWTGYRLGQRVAKVWGNPEYRHFGLKGRLRNYFFDRAVYLDTLEPQRRADRRVRRTHPPAPAGADLRPRPLAVPAGVLARRSRA